MEDGRVGREYIKYILMNILMKCIWTQHALLWIKAWAKVWWAPRFKPHDVSYRRVLGYAVGQLVGLLGYWKNHNQDYYFFWSMLKSRLFKRLFLSLKTWCMYSAWLPKNTLQQRTLRFHLKKIHKMVKKKILKFKIMYRYVSSCFFYKTLNTNNPRKNRNLHY